MYIEEGKWVCFEYFVLETDLLMIMQFKYINFITNWGVVMPPISST